MGEVCEKISWLSVVWRLSNVLMSVFFTLASYVQINDPDAGLWMVGLAALQYFPPGCWLFLTWVMQFLLSSVVLLASDLMSQVGRRVSQIAQKLHPLSCLALLRRKTLPWRRVADLHLMISSAAIFLLGWKLYAERATQIFQQEEGREFSGLTLTAVWLLLCRRSGRAPVGKLRVSTAVAITVFPIVAWLYYHINKELRSDWPSHCKTAI
ncbi:hypothetical protein CCH79_00016537 [Gambusia affinis]|uniref:Transmembrane protein 220 n=1 Tax=Gambusia affinis TaxID=33528 RepID=A0A315UXD6_GAMAF|nr:hypothetical protein CCH79_00016537 [Gambusia affinis]